MITLTFDFTSNPIMFKIECRGEMVGSKELKDNKGWRLVPFVMSYFGNK